MGGGAGPALWRESGGKAPPGAWGAGGAAADAADAVSGREAGHHYPELQSGQDRSRISCQNSLTANVQVVNQKYIPSLPVTSVQHVFYFIWQVSIPLI